MSGTISPYGDYLFTDYEDGSCEVEYEDYGTFSGMDYEAHYKFDPESRAKLTACLRKECRGTLNEMITRKFGPKLNAGPETFSGYLARNHIHYEFFSWCS